MAYAGTTSTSPNVPKLVTQEIAAVSTSRTNNEGGPRVWHYRSTHISSDIEAANFFTDGQYLGFRTGDLLIHMGSTTYVVTSHTVITVGATTTDIGVGTTIGLGA